MSKTHLVFGDAHAHPDHNNDRALWLGELIADVRPDVVVNLGDSADMPSLSSYDKGKRGYYGRTYQRDIAAHADFQDKLWAGVRRNKRKLPQRIVLHGNHEERIRRAIDCQPELEGTISFRDLELEKYYDEIVPYAGTTPSSTTLDGICYAHYFVAGVSGKPLSSEHHANAILEKMFVSGTCGHSHTLDYCVRARGDGRKIMGLVAGCFQDYQSDWTGEIQKHWSSGVAIKRNVEDGRYDLEWVSLDRLRKEYGTQ